MRLVTVTPNFSVADQIDESDVEQLAAAGVRTIIDNRPDAEGGTPMARIEAACARHGIAFHYQPVEFSRLSAADADTFGSILQRAQAPALAYCRSGRRSAALWALAAAPLAGVPGVLAQTARAGVNLDELRPQLEQRAAGGEPTYAAGAARHAYEERWVLSRT